MLGLVLTGGGAKGAYQAGALRYLAEVGLVPCIIAGTSIGALNGAAVACHHNFCEAVTHLNHFWERLGEESILRPSKGVMLHPVTTAARTFVPALRHWAVDFFLQEGLLKHQNAILDPEPIEKLLKEAIDPTALRNGIELWVTVFPSLNIPGLGYNWLIDIVRAKTGTDVHWLCVQDCFDDETIFNLLLAAAALPFAFPEREVNGRCYIDGGLVDNVPLRALAGRGCTHAIIIHQRNAAVWSRDDFPGQTVIEIRPEDRINKSDLYAVGVVGSWLDFSAERIAELKRRGYEDARRCLEPIMATLITVSQQRQVSASLIDSTQMLLDDEPL